MREMVTLPRALASIKRDIERDDAACISRHQAFALAPNKEAPGFHLAPRAKNRKVRDLTLPPMTPIWLLVNSRTFPMECDPCKPHSVRSDCISSLVLVNVAEQSRNTKQL